MIHLIATILLPLLFIACVGWSAWRAIRAWRQARGLRLVACPETHAPAAVSLDAGHAAFTALMEGSSELRLASCSRWKERGRCDEPCVPEVQANGRDGEVRTIATRWFDGKTCVLCGRAILPSGLVDHPAALLDGDGLTIEWPDLAAERLPAAFQTHQPVCWNCHVAETFRRKFPDLVVDR